MLFDNPNSFSNMSSDPFLFYLMIIKAAIILLAILYFIFTLVVVRQVNLMTETFATDAAPIIRASAILYSGLSLGIIVLFIAFLFR